MAKSNARAESDQLFKLQVKGDKYARLLIEQKQRLREIDAQFRRATEEIKELRLKRSEGDQRGGGANAVRARLADEQRELMKLENRLSACRTRESKMIAANVELKKRVDELRAGRVLSQNVFEKHQKKLREVQRQMQESFRLATHIMAERDRVAAQAYAMTTNNMDEQESFDSVFESLAGVIRREKEHAEAYRKEVLEQDPMDLSEDFVRGNMKMEEEQKLKSTLHRLDVTLQEDKRAIETVNEKLQDYESTFKLLQEQMDVDDYHDILAVYTKQEEENFAQFRYVQSLNNEIEQLEEDKHKLELETEKLQAKMKDGSVHARKRMVDDLVETRQRIRKENADYERQRSTALREFQPLARAVDRLYNSLGCNDIVPPGTAPTTSASTDSGKRGRKQSEDQVAMMARINSMNDLLAAHGITDSNILQFLAIIEQRSNEIIEQFSKRLQYQNAVTPARVALGSNLRPSDPSRAASAARAMLPEVGGGSGAPATTPSGSCVTTPSATNHPSQPGTLGGSPMGGAPILGAPTGVSSISITEETEDSFSDDEDADRPMTKAELQRRAAKTVAGLQFDAKVQPMRAKTVTLKKKK